MEFVRGFVIGFSIAAVLGPIGVLCVRRTLARGFLTGFVSGLGAASADACYAAVAAFGISAVAAVLVDQRMWLRLLGGAFLVYLGIRTLRSAPAERGAREAGAGGLVAAYSSTLGLTLSNPTTILSFVGIFAGLSVSAFDGGASVVAGVFAGSTVWWLVLATGVALLRARLTRRVFRLVNVASGVLILAFGAQALQAGGAALVNLR